jgi:hypothetical protein
MELLDVVMFCAVAHKVVRAAARRSLKRVILVVLYHYLYTIAKIGIKIGKSNILMHRMRKLSIPPISIPRKQTTGFTFHYATKFLHRNFEPLVWWRFIG